ncbi:serum response factor homolog A-like [Glycine soja]|uniref:Uncharacterized protein n=1 Tax=Glycine soja TaxID=3848 RepID=A0A0B2SW27_GLYSO|nr:serum response factor homolog A-like [Glycine soja]KHN49060.1 hypothetical protein glysoja_031271 [Glycine soja]RZB66421.1 hypothetical protein D0Y65_042162 [Glycine soja]
MEVQSPAAKRHYDITMSRRTRKQQQQQRQQQQQFPVQGNEKTKSTMDDDEATRKDVDVHVTVETKTTQTVSIAGEVKEGGESDHKSLKQLIIGDDDHKEAKKGSSNNNSNNNNSDHERGGKGGSRNSLGEHFTEEEKQHNLQLVRMQQNKDNLQGLKLKKLVRRYAKVLGHLMKAKRDPHLGGDAGKKPVFKLSA